MEFSSEEMILIEEEYMRNSEMRKVEVILPVWLIEEIENISTDISRIGFDGLLSYFASECIRKSELPPRFDSPTG